jgi:APA family basic amino acid/polyamine antiporter
MLSPECPTAPARSTSAASHAPTALSRELGLFDLIMMGVGMMVGAGAVLGMGEAVRIAGPGGTLIAFALAGVLSLLTAMAYAEMSSAIPRAGSIYNFARIAFGGATGFTAGWIAWFASAAGSLYASLCASYVVQYLAHLGMLGWVPLPALAQERAAAMLIACFFVYCNYRGISETGRAQTFLTLAQTVALGLIAIAGVIAAVRDPSRLANFRPSMPNGWSGVLVCMGLEFVAFEGYEVIATAGDEAVDPRRNLPRAILWSVVIVTLTYLAVAFGLIAAIRNVDMPAWQWLAEQREKAFGEAVGLLLPVGHLLATLTIIFAATSALNATIYSATRVSYALGRDRMLPGRLAHISPRTRTPDVALALTGLLVLSGTACLPILHLAASASVMFLLMFILANLCVLRLRQRMGRTLTYGYLMPMWPLLPVIATLGQMVIAVFVLRASWVAWAIAVTWMGAGLAIFLLYSRYRALPLPDNALPLPETLQDRDRT